MTENNTHVWSKECEEDGRSIWTCDRCSLKVATTGERPPERLEERGNACYLCVPDREACEQAWKEMKAVAVRIISEWLHLAD